MTKAKELFHKIAKEIPDAMEGKMFGALCMKTLHGKAATMFWKVFMIFKLEKETLKEALSLKETQLFDPMGGRPMKGWVQVPFSHSDKWPEYAMKAMEYVKQIKK